MLRAGFEPVIPVTKRPQTYALDRAVTGIGQKCVGAMFPLPLVACLAVEGPFYFSEDVVLVCDPAWLAVHTIVSDKHSVSIFLFFFSKRYQSIWRLKL
jgi:hypothetical protein